MQYKFLINDFRLLRRNLLHDLLRQRENTHTYTFIKALISNTSFKICFWFVTIQNWRKHSKKCTFYTLRFGCSFAAVNTIKPQLL